MELLKIIFSCNWEFFLQIPEDVVSSENINQFKNRLNTFWKNKNTKFEPDCYSYPLAHARHHQLNERRRERAQESRDYTRPQRQ